MELGSEPASGGLSDPDALRLGLALDLHWVQRLVVEYVFVSRCVPSPTRIPPIGATPCSREAVFTTSPMAMP